MESGENVLTHRSGIAIVLSMGPINGPREIEMTSKIESTIGDRRIARDLSDAYKLQTGTWDLRWLREHRPIGNNVTGALTIASDGEYLEVWATESHRPCAASAEFARVS